MNNKCCFAYAGTYGHECGREAVAVGIKPSEFTKTGIFYAYRCAECRDIKGGENTGILRFEPVNPAEHINVFR